MGYDEKMHSKGRLGAVGGIPIVPVMPIAAQVSKGSGVLHLRLMEGPDGGYVRGLMPTIPPGKWGQAVKAMKEWGQVEPSYSGSGAPYLKLAIEPEAHGFGCLLKVGPVTLGRVGVFGDAEIVSVDEPMKEQITAGLASAGIVLPGMKGNVPGDEHNPGAPPEQGGGLPETWVCDECGAVIPFSEGSMVNGKHKPECSGYQSPGSVQ